MSALVDASALLATADRRDAGYRSVTQLLLDLPDELIVPVTVLPEADYLITERVGTGVAIRVLEGIARREMQLEPVTNIDLIRTIEHITPAVHAQAVRD